MRRNPADSAAFTSFIRVTPDKHFMSPPHLWGWSPSPLRPCAFSQAGERYAEFITIGMPAISRILSSLFMNSWSMSCNEQEGVQRLNSASLKYFAVIILVFVGVSKRAAGFIPRPAALRSRITPRRGHRAPAAWRSPDFQAAGLHPGVRPDRGLRWWWLRG